MNHPAHLFWIDSRQAETSRHALLSGAILPQQWPRETPRLTRPMVMDMGPMGMGRRMRRRMREGMRGSVGPALMRGMDMDAMMRGNFTINDRSMDMHRIDFRVKKDSTEIWVVKNASAMPHPFHVHNTQFYILDRGGRAPMPIERGLKDTVTVNAGEEVRILVPFRHYADSRLPYMYHCHNLEHEDAGMMGQFTVEA